MFEGKDVVDLAMTRVGQRYVLGARVHLANPNWSGPWDCAEFVSWACYHAYKQVIAVRPPNIQTGESYSGWWHEASLVGGRAIPVREAIGTVGAILIRKPGFAGTKIGHVAISRGDNSTVEAHSANVGVAVITGANKRDWSGGWLVPGVLYGQSAKDSDFKHSPSKKLIKLTDPFTRGPQVVRVQELLLAAGIDPGPVDGIFGNATAVAIAAFQAEKGLVVDGVVGPETGKALGLWSG
ncbi:MAG: peptidoglycan-binding protein [Erythrobacter sp.]|uniref:C40 family peptidase n=1 Tax=Erythrobacter sp. TaxID=1042 RepID=UPI0025E7A718|nr:peptidoglycan-binding domain-containing protein [Erythrobacter sp.]MCL9999135.1 peptidoglycan-binding protein [Erythrobacter sp.]